MSKKQLAYRHGFCVLKYQNADGSDHAVLWNSRDGVVPRIINSPRTREPLTLVDWRLAPDHVPRVGDRVFVDLTEIRARVFASRRLDILFEDPEGRAFLEAQYPSREAAIDAIAAEMLTQTPEPPPDILDVTSGFIEELLERRRADAEPEVSMKVEPKSLQALPVVEIAGVPFVLDPAMHAGEFQVQPRLRQAERVLGYTRKGEPLTDFFEFAKLFADPSYQILADTEITASVRVSTIWLGVDHGSIRHGAPTIFETQVRFKEGSERPNQHDWRRFRRLYTTEAEALEGHEVTVHAARSAFAKLGAAS